RARLREPRAARARAPERDRQPHRRLGLAPTHRGDALGADAALPATGPGRRLRARLRSTGGPARRRDAAHPVPGAARERVRRSAGRAPPPRVSRHVVILDEAHLQTILTEYAAFYNAERPHRALELGTPIQRTRPAHGPIRASPVLGGLHRTYERVA